MAFSSGFFDAKDRDRVYTAEDFTNYLSSLICNGVLDTFGQCFKLTTHNDLTVTVGTGKAWLNGHYFTNTEPYTLDLSPYVDASFTKYAAIGICCDTSESARECSLVIKAGTTASPFASSGGRTYLTLALARLSAGASAITDANITDCRDDEAVCGYVKCILGKCGVTKLMEQLASLERRTASLEGQIGIVRGSQRAIVFSNAAIGMTALMSSMGHSVNGLMGKVGLLETLKLEDE